MVKEINKGILKKLLTMQEQVLLVAEAIDELTYSISYPSAIRYDGMPHATGYIENNGLVNALAKKERLEIRLEELKKQIKSFVSEVESAISKLPTENERNMIRWFYMEGYSWKEVQLKIPNKSRRTLERYLESALTNLEFSEEVYKKWG